MSLMNERLSLVSEIETFCAVTGLAETSVGSMAVKDSRTVKRIRDGRGVSLTTVERLREFMIDELVRRQPAPAASP